MLQTEADSVSLDFSKSGCGDRVVIGGDKFDKEDEESEFVLETVDDGSNVVAVGIGGDEVDVKFKEPEFAFEVFESVFPVDVLEIEEEEMAQIERTKSQSWYLLITLFPL